MTKKKSEGALIRREFKPKTKNQAEYIRAIVENDIVFCIGPAGTGKAQPIDSIVYTAGGPVPIGSLSVGSRVLTHDSTEAKIIGIFPQGNKPVFKVTFSDGSYTRCCKEHLWTIESPDNFSGRKTVSLEEIMEYGLYTKSGKKKIRIPLCKPAAFSTNNLLIHPYMMGILLGDGCFSNKVSLSTADKEIVEFIENNLVDGHKLTQNGKYDFLISKNSNLIDNYYHTVIRRLGLMNCRSYEKFIPKEYLYSYTNDRLELFYGLMDSDGAVSKDGKCITFTTTSKQLSDDFRCLVESLGGTTTVSERVTNYTYKGILKQGRVSYTHYIKLTLDRYFRLQRKQNRVVKHDKYFPQRFITSIEYDGVEECVCIKLDSKDELYLTDNFIVTHNTACAVGLAVTSWLDGGYDKIVITRPTIATDEKEGGRGIGYLPGDIKEKMDPYMRPIYDEMLTYMDKGILVKAMYDGKIEIAPLDFMRGRTFHDSFVIMDEGQNCTSGQLKMFTTRLGSRSKMVVNGDIEQFDRRGDSCDLKYWVENIVNNEEGIGVIQLDQSDIIRHPVVSRIITRCKQLGK